MSSIFAIFMMIICIAAIAINSLDIGWELAKKHYEDSLSLKRIILKVFLVLTNSGLIFYFEKFL